MGSLSALVRKRNEQELGLDLDKSWNEAVKNIESVRLIDVMIIKLNDISRPQTSVAAANVVLKTRINQWNEIINYKHSTILKYTHTMNVIETL